MLHKVDLNQRTITTNRLNIWSINGRGINESVSLPDLTRYNQIQSNAEEVYGQSTTNIISGFYGKLPALRDHQIHALELFMNKGWLVDGSGIQFKMVKSTKRWIDTYYTVSFDCGVKTDTNSDWMATLTVKVKPTKMIATVDDETYIVVKFGNLEGNSPAKFVTEVESRYGTVYPNTDYGYPE